MIEIKNPYLYTSDDFKDTTTYLEDDLCDSSGYLTLSDQISIITNQSEINNEFRRGMIDNFNDERMKVYEQLSQFEDDPYVTEQLLKAHSGDLVDKEQIYTNAYNQGYNLGYFHQRSDSEAGGTPTLSADGENITNNDDITPKAE